MSYIVCAECRHSVQPHHVLCEHCHGLLVATSAVELIQSYARTRYWLGVTARGSFEAIPVQQGA